MKNLKMILAATLIVAGTTMVNAQDAKKKECDHAHKAHADHYEKGEHVEKMKVELELTDEQVAKIKEIHAKRAEEKKALKDKMHELHKAEKEEIKEVLTKEQIEKMKAMHHKKMEHKQKRTKAPTAQPIKKQPLEKE
ncbi:MAG: Spy/CpxP family protein refolding chaperone [Flavobacteriales bacterium]|nr:Spy/CpxP family protein refolding chaperone [Flavobacteriales bacterium]MCW8911810.1 Spy/CpxP family protein refolding chaperone [Flavobacteriales bacterium]MCW8936419.1 Spy/CpxP family protein refolding chaperone [Flavobacteriales bacterium]MCW8940931.1 Spy/CpxP family protein refolding chaperone [Flavobacteriales bacterium]MCW8967715.1 Spy/CpxP family protein refolding chaperone [Flavobacteriales bacterium]